MFGTIISYFSSSKESRATDRSTGSESPQLTSPEQGQVDTDGDDESGTTSRRTQMKGKGILTKNKQYHDQVEERGYGEEDGSVESHEHRQRQHKTQDKQKEVPERETGDSITTAHEKKRGKVEQRRGLNTTLSQINGSREMLMAAKPGESSKKSSRAQDRERRKWAKEASAAMGPGGVGNYPRDQRACSNHVQPLTKEQTAMLEGKSGKQSWKLQGRIGKQKSGNDDIVAKRDQNRGQFQEQRQIEIVPVIPGTNRTREKNIVVNKQRVQGRNGREGRGYFQDTHQQIEALEKDKAVLAKEMEGLVNEKDALAWELDEHQELVRTKQGQVQDLQVQLRRREQEMMRLQDQLEEQKLNHDAMRNLLELRTGEVRGAKPFLTMADAIPYAVVISMVEDLNSEIYGAAATISDRFTTNDWHREDDGDPESTMVDCLGQGMVQLLRSDDPSTVQENIALAVQASLIMCSQHLVDRWSSDDQSNALLEDIYRSVQSADKPTIDEIVSRMTSRIVAILAIAGCKNEDLAAEAMEYIGGQLVAIGELMVRIRKAVKEDITSSDIYLQRVSHNAVFDPTAMEDEDRSVEPRGRVLCTTALGLERIEKVGQSGGELQRKCLLKPKVLLETDA